MESSSAQGPSNHEVSIRDIIVVGLISALLLYLLAHPLLGVTAVLATILYAAFVSMIPTEEVAEAETPDEAWQSLSILEALVLGLFIATFMITFLGTIGVWASRLVLMVG